MYRKKTSSWLKHWDFILLDLILLELSYLLAHWLYHGTAYYREAPLYRNVFFAIAAIDLVVGLMMESYKGILRRGYWLETKAVAKHAIIVTVCVIAYLFAMKESSNYSRVVIISNSRNLHLVHSLTDLRYFFGFKKNTHCKNWYLKVKVR